MQYQIKGTITPHVEVQLGPGETVFTESGAMAWMDEGVEMNTGGSGGPWRHARPHGLGRGGLRHQVHQQSGGDMVAFVPEAPRQHHSLTLGAGESIMAQKDAFLVAEESVTFEISFNRKLGAGLFGGEGFILQKFTAQARCSRRSAARCRNTIWPRGKRSRSTPATWRCSSPASPTDIARVKGVRNMLFGGEGLFLATVTGRAKSGCSACRSPTSRAPFALPAQAAHRRAIGRTGHSY